jgi:GTP-binding protein
LRKLGLDVADDNLVVALAGNPNTGKSTVFNALTGLRQHGGNWPGTTVSRAEGAFEFSGRAFTVVDLPGTYSLLSTSRDEDVARDFLLFGVPDVTVVVVDATRLERNLKLVLQVLQITSRVVVALSLMDEAHRHGIEVDVRHLTRELGVPVVPLTARRGVGVPDLLQQIHDVASGASTGRPGRRQQLGSTVSKAVDRLAEQLLGEFPGLPTPAGWPCGCSRVIRARSERSVTAASASWPSTRRRGSRREHRCGARRRHPVASYAPGRLRGHRGRLPLRRCGAHRVRRSVVLPSDQGRSGRRSLDQVLDRALTHRADG